MKIKARMLGRSMKNHVWNNRSCWLELLLGLGMSKGWGGFEGGSVLVRRRRVSSITREDWESSERGLVLREEEKVVANMARD
jgi:hypothetical protein